jgi:hypothetical protein
MHFTSAIIVVALISLIFATAVDAAGADECLIMCVGNGPCKACPQKECVSISIFPGIDNDSPDAFTWVQYCHWY